MAQSGFIFDLDGVLWNTAPLHAEAFRQVFERRGLPAPAYEGIAGARTDDAITRHLTALQRPVDVEDLRAMVREKRARFLALLDERPPDVSAARAALEQLAATHALALASSASRATVDAFLARLGARGLFRAVLCGDDVRAAKPDPEIFARAAAALGATDVVVVEDAVNGVVAATAAGLDAIGFAGTVPAQALLRAGASFVVESLDALLPYARFARASTLILPAAGRGSRLGVTMPKALVPVCRRPLCRWILDEAGPLAQSTVVVVAPGTMPAFATELAHDDRLQLAVQASPLGMADAVAAGLERVPEETTHVWVVWSDQIGLRRRTLMQMAHAHCARGAAATIASVKRNDAYIRLVRDARGKLIDVIEAREQDETAPAGGESDCGVFLFRRDALLHVLRWARDHNVGIGRRTGEWNLLPLLPAFEALGGVATVEVDDVSETWGVNTPAELTRAEELLRARQRAR